MTFPRPRLLLSCAVLLLTGGPGARPFPEPETLSIGISEGTALGLDVSRDGRTIVFDLLGQLWRVPEAGGVARAVTDAVADTAEDRDPALSPDGRRIAFTGERAGRRGLWLLEPGARPVQLYQLPDPDAFAGEPAWSPDGTRIAFARSRAPDSAGGRPTLGISLVDPATREIRDLRIEGVGDAFLRAPAWSADGRRIAFVAMARRMGRIWILDANGGTAAPLTPEGLGVSAPALSPDGRQVAYFAPDSAGAIQLWVHSAAGGADSAAPARRLTGHDDVAATRVRWSADGRTLYYAADGKLRKISAAGGTPGEIPFTARLVVSRPRRDLPPARFPEPGAPEPARGFMGLALSPDAQRIGVIALGKLWIAPVGGEARAIADVPPTARYLAWAPDGAEVAWSAGAREKHDLYATDVATGATRRVTALEGDEVYPAYSPDGRWLAFTHTDSLTRLRIVAARGATVSDTAATRSLGPADAAWNGSDIGAPQWSPDSDALLRMIGPDLGPGFAAELVPLSGPRTPVTMPDAPSFFRWTRDGLVWARHDRLWTAPFGRDGIEGPPRPLGDAPAIYPSAAADGTLLFVSEGGLRLRAPSGSERQLGWPIRYTPPVPEPLLIRSVRIIDGTGAAATPPRDLLVERGRIARIAAAGSLPAEGRRVVDAAGRFAMPGLMDLHAHTYVPELLPGFLYFGVTLVRDQGASIAPVVAWADGIAAGVLPGPRVSYGAFQYYTDWGFDEDQGRGVEPEADPGHVARAVALAAAFGAHHIKTRTFRRWDINAKLVGEAHRRGMRATGHCATQLPLVAAGMDAKEHIGYCGAGSHVLYDDMSGLLRAAGTGVVPTISYVAMVGIVTERPDLLEGDPELAPFLPPASSFDWMRRMSPADRAGWARDARQARATAARLARAGLTIGTGTDVWQVPAAVHMEMQELVAAGLTPLEAIRTATSSSARIVGAERDLGTIEVGKLADLILLDADPAADIRNTRRIWSVIQGGRVVDRAGILERYRLRP